MPPTVDPETNDNQYLWDGTGPTDIAVAALEKTLAPLRYKPQPRKPGRYLATGGAIAAAVALLLWVYLPGTNSTWNLALGDGTEQRVRVGQKVTAERSEVHLSSAGTGYLQLEPNSRLRVLGSGKDTERVALEYGAMRAVIWAPAAKFGVELPAATAVDLGCIYRLETTREGDGILRVETGWVALQNNNLESFIPAGASSHIDRVKGPGIPVFDDAPDALKAAVGQIDSQNGDRSVDTVLALARPKDGLTLWHLLQRTEGQTRARVASRFVALAPLPDGLDAEALSQASPESLDAAWNALQLGSTDWWRTWKQQWQPR